MRRLARGVAVGAASLAVVAGSAPPVDGNSIRYDSFQAVSCAGRSSCVAVGDIAARWDGHAWTAVPLASELQLNSVSCSSTSNCIAVGTSSAGGAAAERWNGLAWTRLGKPHGSWLNSVSCPVSSWCMAVGGSRAGTGGIGSVAETWSRGRWRTLVVPGEPGATINELKRLSCASPTVCVAIDDYSRSRGGLGVGETGALDWNGRVWKVVPSPHPLVDVSCLHGVSLAGCTYLSYFETSPGAVSLSTVSDRPAGWVGLGDIHGSTPIKANPGLFAYTCSSASSCMTVGYTVHPARTMSAYIETYATRWNGSRWSTTITPSPPPPSVEGGDDVLNAVSCPAPEDCKAVGIASFTPLIESWNGSRWVEQRLG